MNLVASPATQSLTPSPFTLHAAARLLTPAALLIALVGVAAAFRVDSVPLFWLSFVAGLAVLAAHAVATRSTEGVRWLAIAGVGAWCFVPKFLLSPSTPLFREELAHWSATDAALRSEQLFRNNLISPNIRLYPGLEAVASGLVSLTGLPIWHVAVVLVAIAKVAALVAIALVAVRLGASMQTAAIAAVVYALGPAFLFFDSQYTSEPWALTLMLWVVVAALSAFDRASTPRQTTWWLAVATLATLGVVASDFLTGLVLVGVLAMVLLGRTPTRLSATRRLSPAVVLFVAFDIVLVYEILVGGGDGLGQLFSGDDAWHTGFAASAPWYEQTAAVLAPVMLLAAAAVGVRRLWRQHARSMPLAAMGVFGLLYFVSLPLLLSDTAGEVARRSTSFTFIGLSLLVAVALSPQWSTGLPAPLRRPRVVAAVGVALSVVVVGNATVGADFDRRFPGDDGSGSAQAITDEQIDLANWIEAIYGPGTRVVADRTTSAALAGYGLARTTEASDAMPVWRLLMEPDIDDFPVLTALRDNGAQLLVVDRRMTETVLDDGFAFSPDEPDSLMPISPAALDRLDAATWLQPVLRTEHLTVYAFDFDQLGVGS